MLTSWDGVRLAAELAIPESIEQRVPVLAQLAVEAGIGGCVCSPLEAQALRLKHPEPFALVTPGIRPKDSFSGSDSVSSSDSVSRSDSGIGDQVRVMGPAEAIAAGASQLVIGRPISKAEDPASAFAACCQVLAA